MRNCIKLDKGDIKYEQVCCENSIMNEKNKTSVFVARALLLLTAVTIITAGAETVKAKSLYMIADHVDTDSDNTQPVHAYNIGADGKLTFQAEHRIRHRMLGAVGAAIDSDSGYLFITYEIYEKIRVVDGTTMTDVDEILAEGARDLAGIVYDHSKGLLYCVDRGSDRLFAYEWDPKTVTLTPLPGSPFTLWSAKAYGIALDEIDGFLYVGNASNTVTVYSTENWRKVDTIDVGRVAISVAVDVMNGYLYTGGGFAGNNYLTQYHLSTGKKISVQVEPDAGVMGLAVDPDTGLVYLSTGKNNAPGGDNLLVYDMDLNQISKMHVGGNPTGIAIPGKDIGFNPLNLTKQLISGASQNTKSGEIQSVGTGKNITYGIGFSNRSNEFTVTDITVVDALPHSVTFVSADDDGVNGRYDSNTHTYRWTYKDLPPGTSTMLNLTVLVDRDVEAGSLITNSVTINSNQTPTSTTKLDVIAKNNSLNLQKTIKGAPDGRIATVESDDLITYTLCYDNLDNDFTVTDILLVDTLPPEVDFVSADKGTGSVQYDTKSHTVTWNPADLKPGSSVCLDMMVRVVPDLPPGTVIRNSAVIDCKELPVSMATIDAITSFSGLGISKVVVGNTENPLMLVGENDEIEYIICFENRNTETVTNVTVVDTLPQEVSFVKARSDGAVGRYDPKTHTYMWSFSSLEPNPKSPTCVEIVVRVNKDIAPATTITNTATISSHETDPATVTNSNVSTYFNPLGLKKTLVGEFGGNIEWVNIGDQITYGFELQNNNDFTITNVTITDRLPKEVSFVTASDDGVFGSYDPNSHTYQWVLPSLQPGESGTGNLVVQVNSDVKPNTTITNTAKIDSDQTAQEPSETDVDVKAENPVILGPDGLGGFVTVLPNMLRDNNSTNDLLVTIELPEGFEKEDIDISKEIRAVLRNAETGIDGMVAAKRQILDEAASPAKIYATFDRAQIMELLPGLGEFQLVIKGRYVEKGSFRSYRGDATVHVLRFAGY